jgi:hypothetical protein
VHAALQRRQLPLRVARGEQHVRCVIVQVAHPARDFIEPGAALAAGERNG